MSGDGATEIPIAELSVQQLQQLSQQLEQEIEFMTGSLQQLKEVQQKFIKSQETLTTITPENAGKDILLPLTSSMYATGQLDDMKKVMVDVGTGYYVEMSVDGASAHFKRKIDYLTKQMEKLQAPLQEKYKMKQAVMETLQTKVQATLQAQQAAASTKSS